MESEFQNHHGKTPDRDSEDDFTTSYELTSTGLVASDALEPDIVVKGARNASTPEPRVPLRLILISSGLFLLCCLSTFYIGSGLWQAWYIKGGFETYIRIVGWENVIYRGLTYTVPVMAILLAHEMGHFLQALRYGVPATTPFFIPMPIPPLGTMGAIILQQPGIADRKANFDIAISGPLAGLVLALPITWYAVLDSTIAPKPPANQFSFSFGEPLILQWMIYAHHGVVPEGKEVFINSIGIAGWVGIFITALNMIPIGQLDGGHILYALIGKKAHRVAVALIGFALLYMIYTQNFTYILMLMLIMMLGARHPPTANDNAKLGPVRVVLGWLTLGFVIIGFTPTPIIAN